MHETVSCWFCIQTEFRSVSSGKQTTAIVSPHGHSKTGKYSLDEAKRDAVNVSITSWRLYIKLANLDLVPNPLLSAAAYLR